MDEWTKTILVGLCTGLGSAVGIYFANKHLITKMEKLDQKLKENVAKPIPPSIVKEIPKSNFENLLEQIKKSKTL